MELSNLSPTVQDARSKLTDRPEVSAMDVSQAILDNHQDDYARSLPRPQLNSSSAQEHHHVDGWLEEIRTLFNTTSAPEIHGRLALLGLSMLEPGLRTQLQEHDFLEQLSLELNEPIDSILSERGRDLWFVPITEDSSVVRNNTGESITGDSVITTPGQGPAQGPDRESELNHSDNPVTKKEDDQLGRHAYARYLAGRLQSADEKTAQAIHVSGPWGAGKSTMLNFLRSELEQNDWMVVEFNAWQNQHLRPPWWAIQDRVFEKSTHIPNAELGLLDKVPPIIRHILLGIRDSKIMHRTRAKITTENENDIKGTSKETTAPLSGWDLFYEEIWRLSVGRTHYFVCLFFVALISSIAFFALPPNGGLVTSAKNTGAVLSTIIAIWAASQSISLALSARSTQSAQSYLDTITDPTGKMVERFSCLIDRIKAKRVAIFIDDLDRCQSEYVVELLEGIQTILGKAPVIFVVAADQRWLNACFEDVYGKLKPHVQEPGKPLGILFLEKLFQFEAPTPGVPEDLRKFYWEYLLNMDQEDREDEVRTARARAKEELKNQAPLEDSTLEAIDQSQGESKIYQQIFREESAVYFATLTKQIQKHTLEPFAHLLEPNPRSMKRLVNAYSVNRALSTLTRKDIPPKKLALWTILSMRWPKLAEYLADNPQNIDLIDEFYGEAAIGKLLNDPEVVDVIRGKTDDDSDVKTVVDALDVETIKKCAQLKM